MFSGLRLVRNCAAEDIPEVEFILPGNTPSPDFRLGDIVLFYVCDTDADRVSTRQVFKATIASMTADRVVLRLRDNQSYAEALPIASCYAVEHDYVFFVFVTVQRFVCDVGCLSASQGFVGRRGGRVASPKYVSSIVL